MKGVGHGMNRRKVILVIFIGVLFIGAIAIGVFNLRETEDLMTMENGDYQVTIYDLTLEEMGLTEEQFQLLRDSILHIDHMNAARRRNAWLMLDAMAEIEFVENRSSGESAVGRATGVLDVLGVGEIQELTVVRVLEEESLAAVLVMQIVNTEDRTYYLWYNRTWGLGVVTRDNENGEMIYNSLIHVVRYGQLCEREYARGPIIYCSDE